MDAARSNRRFRASASALLASVIVSGCALWRDPDPPAFQRVDLQAEVEKDSDGELEGDLHADTTIKGALLASGGLGVSGAGIGFSLGFGCGPLGAVVCVPVFTVAGLVIGGVTGAVLGGIGGLPWETAGQVDQILVDVQRRRDFATELERAIETEIPREKQASADQAEAVVTARLDSVDLRQHYSERLSVRVYGSMIQQWDRGSGDPKQRTCNYEFTTTTRDVEDWLLDDGKLFDTAFSDAIQHFASWMARDLDAFATRRPLPASEGAPETCFQD